MEKQIHVCEECGRSTFDTREHAVQTGWGFIIKLRCPSCRPQVKRNDCYKRDMCFATDWESGEQIRF